MWHTTMYALKRCIPTTPTNIHSPTFLPPQHPLNQHKLAAGASSNARRKENDKFDWRFDWQRHFVKNKKFLKEANIINNMY